MADGNKQMRDRFRGTLLGLAVGDALGAPVEFMTAEQIRQKYSTLTEMVGGGWLKIKPGEYTDDTNMMLCIAESLVANNGYNPDDIAQRFVQWLKSDPKNIGNTTRKSLERIASGIPWKDAGDINGIANGSVMRCAPVGLIYAFDEQNLIWVSKEISAMTHAHEHATISCVFLNTMIAQFVQGESVDYAFLVALLKSAFDNSTINPSFVFKFLASIGGNPNPASGLAMDTMVLAIKNSVKAATFEEAVITAVNLGGDTDTIGAVTGALAGARFGASTIPQRWYSKLNPYSAKQIKELADGLFDLALK